MCVCSRDPEAVYSLRKRVSLRRPMVGQRLRPFDLIGPSLSTFRLLVRRRQSLNVAAQREVIKEEESGEGGAEGRSQAAQMWWAGFGAGFGGEGLQA